MNTLPPRKTPLYDMHVASNAKIVDFAGWLMPIQYSSIKAEHHAVRERIGLFDVSHMGRVEIRGAKALQEIQPWVCNDVAQLKNMESLYSPICNEKGGIVDDCLVYRIQEDHFIIIINGSNREKDYQWFQSHRTHSEVTLFSPEEGDKWALIAVQGPNARALLQQISKQDLHSLQHNQFAFASLAHIDDCIVACTGYTGEDGFEIFVPTQEASALWQLLLEEGKEKGIEPCGLGARDTLRLEMKYPLYGNDIDDETTPIDAGLKWTVAMEKGDFIGREHLVQPYETKPPRRLIGFVLQDKGVARHGYTLWNREGTQEIGIVTSGGFSPTRNESIGIGYVPSLPEFAKIGSELTIDIRGKKIPVEVVSTPFVKK